MVSKVCCPLQGMGWVRAEAAAGKSSEVRLWAKQSVVGNRSGGVMSQTLVGLKYCV